MKGTIRVIDCYGPSLAEDEWPRPDNPGHYSNWEPQPAAPFIQKLINEYSTLESVPANGAILADFDTYVSPVNPPTWSTHLFESHSHLQPFDKEKFFSALRSLNHREGETDSWAIEIVRTNKSGNVQIRLAG